MIIQWLGYSCVKLAGQQTETTIVIDPFVAQEGVKMSKQAADVVIVSTGDELHNAIDLVKKGDKVPFVIDTPGEFEVTGAFVTGVGVMREDGKGETTVTTINIDDLFVGHLGALSRTLKVEELDAIGRIDVLFVPIGGHGVLAGKLACEVIAQIDPRIVIPIHYSEDGEQDLEPLAGFLKTYGLTAPEAVDKYKVSKKELPVEETRLVILTRA